MVTKISLTAKFLSVDGISKVKTNVQEKTNSASFKSSADTDIKSTLHFNSDRISFYLNLKRSKYKPVCKLSEIIQWL